MINRIEKGILINFLEILFVNLFATSSARFIEFTTRNLVLFQIKVFGRNVKETSFTRLRVIIDE